MLLEESLSVRLASGAAAGPRLSFVWWQYAPGRSAEKKRAAHCCHRGPTVLCWFLLELESIALHLTGQPGQPLRRKKVRGHHNQIGEVAQAMLAQRIFLWVGG